MWKWTKNLHFILYKYFSLSLHSLFYVLRNIIDISICACFYTISFFIFLLNIYKRYNIYYIYMKLKEMIKYYQCLLIILRCFYASFSFHFNILLKIKIKILSKIFYEKSAYDAVFIYIFFLEIHIREFYNHANYKLIFSYSYVKHFYSYSSRYHISI